MCLGERRTGFQESFDPNPYQHVISSASSAPLLNFRHAFVTNISFYQKGSCSLNALPTAPQ